MMTPSILLIGAGEIASVLGQQLLAQDWSVTGLRRHIEKLPAGFSAIGADLTHPDSLHGLTGNYFDYVVITLAPTQHDEAAYRQTYIEGTRNALSALQKMQQKPKHLFFASSTGIYGESNGGWADENSTDFSEKFNGIAMHDAEQLVLNSGIPASNIRFGGIYGPTRTALLREVKAGNPSPRDHKWSNRIHQDDAVNVLHYLLNAAIRGKKLADCYVAVDDEPAPLCEVKNWLANQLGLPHHWPASPDNTYGSRRCSNARLKSLGYEFMYPDYRSGYKEILAG
jgi:nucleoside-diphosphate-sugar epimerase